MFMGIWGVGENDNPLIRTCVSCVVRVYELKLCIICDESCAVRFGLKNDGV